MEVRGQIYAPTAFPTGNIPGAYKIRGCVGPRTGLDYLEDYKNFLKIPGLEPRIFHF